ncbi:MAG: UDP-N-acetylmuramoyl-L-alanyl-D-glutamate--2,6-diaminopimelate ligase [Candidatus Aminicenantes bacterium]|nr:UDP-N-acetylmuramoyl-L-alanyl-D-glutamate--2,6-diaminopimelate ligase [Candidatus Aminicenantes bacterium]
MKLKDLLKDVPFVRLSGNKNEDIQGISYSSKKVGPGYLFTALKGEKTDGHIFIQEALQNGAAGVLSEQERPENFPKIWIQVHDARNALALCSVNFYKHPSEKLKIVGITGTKGKTTISYVLEEIIRKAGLRPGIIGTISYRWQHKEIKAERTTPEASDLQGMLRKMADQGVTHCLMEVSSHSLELNRVTGIKFDVAIFSNLSGEHLDYHKSMGHYFEAKKKLFFSEKPGQIVIINADDPWGKRLLDELSSEAISYGLSRTATVYAENFSFKENGIQAVIKYPAGQMAISSPLIGKPNLYNILAAASAAFILNIPQKAILEGIKSLRGIPGRFEKIENPFGLHIFVDYAHTDDALKNLLETARELCKKRVILVFGAGGDRDKAKRPRMGEVAGSLSDWTILTSDNPRSEDPMAIISDIEKGMKKTGTKNYEILPDRKQAIKKALLLAKKGDYVLIAGKGHEGYQIIKNKVTPFNDAEIIREYLKEMEGQIG